MPGSRSARVGRLGAVETGHGHRDQRPKQPTGDDPDRGPDHQRQHDAEHGAGARGHELAPPGHEPGGEAGHRRREDHVEPERRRVRDRAAQELAGERREVPRDEHAEHGRDPVAADVDAPDPEEVRRREGERLVGQDVGHPDARVTSGTSRTCGASEAL